MVALVTTLKGNYISIYQTNSTYIKWYALKLAKRLKENVHDAEMEKCCLAYNK